MSLQELSSIGELVAASATVVALGYLALQIRQHTQSERISAELDYAKIQNEWYGRMNAQPDLLRL